MITFESTGHRSGGLLLSPDSRRGGTRLLASVDVEWTKNYRIKNGNVPFCYSVTYVELPADGRLDLANLSIRITSHYVEDSNETPALVSAAATEIAACLRTADLVIGHQLSSDLAVLAAAVTRDTSDPEHERSLSSAGRQLQAARVAWRGRRDHAASPSGDAAGEGSTGRLTRVLDTRYDSDHVLTQRSRRLVDVCSDLRLHVTQPELRGTSMTALHRRWLEVADPQARERITVLNLRHSLSAALVALKTTGDVDRDHHVDVNRLLLDQLPAGIGWLNHPQFTAALASPDSAAR